MKQPATMYTGPLGSTFHILHADPETVTALANDKGIAPAQAIDAGSQVRP